MLEAASMQKSQQKQNIRNSGADPTKLEIPSNLRKRFPSLSFLLEAQLLPYRPKKAHWMKRETTSKPLSGKAEGNKSFRSQTTRVKNGQNL